MAEIEVLILTDSIRYTPTSNDPATSVDPVHRAAHSGVTFEETATGVRINHKGAAFTFVPWSMIRQVIYRQGAPAQAVKK